MTKDIAKKLIEDGKIERGYIGVTISNLNEQQKEIYKNKEGALISSVEKGLPADEAGLKRGDLVISANDKPIKNANDLKNFIGSLSPNSSVDLTYERSGKIMNAKFKLANMETSAKASKESAIIDGLSVTTLTDDTRFKFKLNPDTVGVLVTDVKTGSKAEDFGFERGDIIVQVGEEIVKDVQSFSKMIKQSNGKKTLVWVNRRGIMQGLVVK